MTLRTLTSLPEMISTCRDAGLEGTVGFVPTMGAIHEGHLSLVRAARETCDTVVVSIFVNPLQFGPDEDLDAYPRREAEDAELVASAGADVLLLIDRDEMYPPGFATTITQSEALVTTLEGECRPGHFEGVLTVVAKLFGLVGPCRAFFGRKDYQQTVVIRRMVADLNLPVDVVVCPTVREPDGLAMSSRNAYLGPERRAAALSLVSALRAAETAFAAGERSATALEARMEAVLRDGTDEPEYACLVDPLDMSRRDVVRAGDVAVVAARVGPARLIDNHVLGDTLPGLSPAP